MAFFKLLGGIKTLGLGFDSTAYVFGNVFELYPVRITPKQTPLGGGIMGSIPLAPGQVQDLYQPIDSPFLVPFRKEYRPTTMSHVGIKIKFQGDDYFSNEQYFLINEPTDGFTVQITPLNIAPNIITFKSSSEKISIIPSKPKISLKLQRRVKIKKTDK